MLSAQGHSVLIVTMDNLDDVVFIHPAEDNNIVNNVTHIVFDQTKFHYSPTEIMAINKFMSDHNDKEFVMLL